MKPDLRIFRTALDRLGIDAGETLMTLGLLRNFSDSFLISGGMVAEKNSV